MKSIIRKPNDGITAILQMSLASLAFVLLFYLGFLTLVDYLIVALLPQVSPDTILSLKLSTSVVLLLILSWIRHKEFGLHLGSFPQEYQFVLLIVIPVLLLEILYLSISKTSPLSGLSWQYFVLVPLQEEILFRSLIFSTVLIILSKFYSTSQSGWIAVAISSIAFSTAHLLNIGSLPLFFIAFQLLYSFVLGVAFGYLRFRTGSVVPSLILHAMFNWVGIAVF